MSSQEATPPDAPESTARKYVRQISRPFQSFREQAISAEGFCNPLDLGGGSTDDITTDEAPGVGLSALDSPITVPDPAPRKPTAAEMVTRDKINFFLGIVNVVLSSFWLGKSPQTWYRWFTVKAIVLFMVRFYLYSRKRWAYYMLEFCYFVNALLLVQIWCFPNSPTLNKVVFALTAGPISLSIPALRNSLVLHSLDKTTSLFMHLSPAVMGWCIHWYYPQWETSKEASWWELTVLPMGAYLVWAVAYYLKVFVISSKKIQQENYSTLYTLMLANKKGAAARIVLRAPAKLQPLVYMLNHLLLCWAAVIIAALFWNRFWLHTMFLIACSATSAWNGANYYFEIFTRKYLASVGLESPSVDGRKVK